MGPCGKHQWTLERGFGGDEAAKTASKQTKLYTQPFPFLCTASFGRLLIYWLRLLLLLLLFASPHKPNQLFFSKINKLAWQ